LQWRIGGNDMAKPITYTVTDGKLVLTLEVAEEGGFIVTAPFNSNVLTQAETLEEAFEMAYDVIALFKEERKAVTRKKTRTQARLKAG
jgi:antitoxin HicB